MGKNHKPHWVWTAGSVRAQALLSQVLPYLKTKKKQAEYALEFRALFRGRGHWKMPTENVLMRELYYRRMKQLNTRGVKVA